VGVRPLFNVEVSKNSLVENTLQPILFLPGQLLMVYLLLYFIIPRCVLKAKYTQAIFWGTALCVVSGFIAAYFNVLLNDAFVAHFLHRFEIRNGLFAAVPAQRAYKIDYGQLPYEFLFGLRAVLNVAGFAAALKLLKYWYEKEYLNSVLQREKLDAELQSLKAQLHPHFLFNTLNNIYSITENVSQPASDMLLKLSALLRYMLYDCNKPQVKLSQECRLVEDYIALEKVRYKSIDVNVVFPANADRCLIAPLLLLPLVENCFKHGASRVLEQPWININLEIKENVLQVKIINGMPAVAEGAAIQEGIGLGNVKKRLSMLYPGRHDMLVMAEGEVFIVQLKLTLEAA
jgi:hypothetical protein